MAGSPRAEGRTWTKAGRCDWRVVSGSVQVPDGGWSGWGRGAGASRGGRGEPPS